MEYFVWVDGLPLPPTVNDYLIPVRNRLVKTKTHADYDRQFSMWVIRNLDGINSMKHKIKLILNQREYKALRVDMYFCFHEPRLISKLGDIQKLDRDNRIKPATDQMHKLIGVDDKHIFAGNSEKVITQRKDEECLIVRISTMKPRTKQQILEQMSQETSRLDKNKS